jgi:hypothetical protein
MLVRHHRSIAHLRDSWCRALARGSIDLMLLCAQLLRAHARDREKEGLRQQQHSYVCPLHCSAVFMQEQDTQQAHPPILIIRPLNQADQA